MSRPQIPIPPKNPLLWSDLEATILLLPDDLAEYALTLRPTQFWDWYDRLPDDMKGK